MQFYNLNASFTMEVGFAVQEQLSVSNLLCFKNISDYSICINFLVTLRFYHLLFQCPLHRIKYRFSF